jgi:glutamate dehydrogenase (NAD(P)+)
MHDPAARLQAVVVIDTIRMGPSGGGVRMAPDVSLAEVARLARAMTLKYALLGMPIGGAKAGIVGDPSHPARASIVRAFVEGLQPLLASGLFVPGPDMGTFASDFGSGLEVDETLTGYGVVVAAKSAAELVGRTLDGAHVAIEGFGKVGTSAARGFVREGAKVVAVSTVHGTLYDPDGLDVEALSALRDRDGDADLERAPAVRRMPREALFAVPCDVLVPGARPDVVDTHVAQGVSAWLVVPGSNAPYAEGALEVLDARGVLAVPDFVANAGGVLATVCALQGLRGDEAREVVRGAIARNVRRVAERARQGGGSWYGAALELAREAVSAS